MMEVTIFKNEKNSVEVGVKGIDKAVMQALVEKLTEDSGVEFAAFKTTHPIVGFPVIFLKTKRKDALDLLVGTIENMETEIEEFTKKFKSAVKE